MLERGRTDSVVCRLSVLAPVYAIHANHSRDDGTERESWMRYPPLPPEFQPYEAKVARLVESTLGATRYLRLPPPRLRSASAARVMTAASAWVRIQKYVVATFR